MAKIKESINSSIFFALKNSEYPDLIPFIPANVEGFFLIFLIALIIELLKTAFITYSVKIFALICNISWE